MIIRIHFLHCNLLNIKTFNRFFFKNTIYFLLFDRYVYSADRIKLYFENFVSLFYTNRPYEVFNIIDVFKKNAKEKLVYSPKFTRPTILNFSKLVRLGWHIGFRLRDRLKKSYVHNMFANNRFGTSKSSGKQPTKSFHTAATA